MEMATNRERVREADGQKRETNKDVEEQRELKDVAAREETVIQQAFSFTKLLSSGIDAIKSTFSPKKVDASASSPGKMGKAATSLSFTEAEAEA